MHTLYVKIKIAVFLGSGERHCQSETSFYVKKKIYRVVTINIYKCVVLTRFLANISLRRPFRAKVL